MPVFDKELGRLLILPDDSQEKCTVVLLTDRIKPGGGFEITRTEFVHVPITKIQSLLDPDAPATASELVILDDLTSAKIDEIRTLLGEGRD